MLQTLLTHLPLDKMAAILQTVFLDRWIFVYKKFFILIKIWLKFVLKDLINNNPAFV